MRTDFSGLRRGIIMNIQVRLLHELILLVVCNVLILVMNFAAQSKTIVPSLCLWSDVQVIALIALCSNRHAFIFTFPIRKCVF